MQYTDHNMFNNGLINRAFIFAAIAHKNQMRKWEEDTPYISHPVAVAKILYERIKWKTPELIAAALLHDVIEDTEVDVSDLEDEFGPEITKLVMMVTKVSEKEMGNRALRKEIDACHYSLGSKEGQTIKVADIIHNCTGLDKLNPKFWKVYRVENQQLLAKLKLADPDLLSEAWEIVGVIEDI